MQKVAGDLLRDTLKPYAEEKLANDWIFQADNDPKHTSKKTKTFVLNENWKVMIWPAQSLDLLPIEMLWGDIKKEICRRKPKNKDQCWE